MPEVKKKKIFFYLFIYMQFRAQQINASN